MNAILRGYLRETDATRKLLADLRKTDPATGCSHPEWLLVSFPRLSAVSEFQVAPRTQNGGYGPKALAVLLNGGVVYTGTMAPTNTLDVVLTPPVYATNAELLITSSYDPAYPTNSRNVQVVGWSLFERAQPGTFGDWRLQHFTAAQLTNSAVSDANADPDGDGVPNLLEFAVGGNPLTPDPTNATVQGLRSTTGQFVFQFKERNPLGDVTRQFQSSGDLLNWTNAAPILVNPLQNLGTTIIYQAQFPLRPAVSFYRLQYNVTN